MCDPGKQILKSPEWKGYISIYVHVHIYIYYKKVNTFQQWFIRHYTFEWPKFQYCHFDGSLWGVYSECNICLLYAATRTLTIIWYYTIDMWRLLLHPYPTTINATCSTQTLSKTELHLTSTRPAGLFLWLATVTPSHMPSTISDGFAVDG